LNDMGTIAHLPDRMQHAWRSYERELRKALDATGVEAGAVESAIGALRPVFLRVAEPGTFSGNPHEVVERMNAWVQQQVFGLLMEVAIREVQLWRAGFRE
jgi:hypothetical protein